MFIWQINIKPKVRKIEQIKFYILFYRIDFLLFILYFDLLFGSGQSKHNNYEFVYEFHY